MRVLIGQADFIKKRLGLEDLSSLESWQLASADQPLPAADLYLDLSGCFARFRPDNTPTAAWWFVHAPAHTLDELPPQTIRLNAWPGFAAGSDWEMAWKDEAATPVVAAACASLNKNPLRVPDQIGFIGARVLASIIQEALMLKEEGAASSSDIDLAMKLGTNYPRGPFEWAEEIGWDEVKEVIERVKGEG